MHPTDPGDTDLLTPIQARVLGSLVEKEATTPDTYPLTANAVHLACNQKTSRDPVMDLEPGTVGHALRELEARRLVASVHGARAQRYEHRFAQGYSVTRPQQALLAMLLLRGPQTASELLVRCERMASFEDLAQVRDTLDRLAQRTPALVANVGRGAGQREDRWMHLLSGPVDAEALRREPRPGARSLERDDGAAAQGHGEELAALRARIEALEVATTELREEMAQLRQRD